MHRILLLCLLGVVGCETTPAVPAHAVERIQVVPAEVARVQLRYGGRLAEALGVPARSTAARSLVDTRALHRAGAGQAGATQASTASAVQHHQTQLSGGVR
jgi:hypothetical protein